LLDYNSPSSQSVSNRLVEPFAFNERLDTVYGYEPSSRKNKFFKLERIGQVRLEQIGWQFEYMHEQQETDIFGIPFGEEKIVVRLLLGRLASNLLREEHPAALPFLQPQPDGRNILELRVADFRGTGRFTMGLVDDLEVLGPVAFKAYLAKLAKLLQLWLVALLLRQVHRAKPARQSICPKNTYIKKLAHFLFENGSVKTEIST